MADGYRTASRWQRWTWRHPEWWSLGLSLLAWLSLLVPRASSAVGFNALSWHHHLYTNSMLLPWSWETLSWMVMVVAMMLPLIVDSTRVTATRSLWERRPRNVSLFILGYLAVWMVAGVVASVAIVILVNRSWFRPAIGSAIAFGLAACWQFTAAKRRALASCHRTIPLAPHGWRADADCLRYGKLIGGNCLVSCGALMLACALSGHNLAAMVGAASITTVERYAARPDLRVLATAIAGVGAICVFLMAR